MTDLITLPRATVQQALEALETVFMPFHPAVIDLKAALEQPERPNLLGWSFHRNSDGSIGIKSPPPKPGESQRTGESVYHSTDGGGLHELLSKFVDHIAALAQPRQFTSFVPKPPSPPPAPGGYDGTEAGLQPFSWSNHV